MPALADPPHLQNVVVLLVVVATLVALVTRRIGAGRGGEARNGNTQEVRRNSTAAR